MDSEIDRKKANKYVLRWSYKQGNKCPVCNKPISHLAKHCNNHAQRRRKNNSNIRLHNGYRRIYVLTVKPHWQFEHRYIWSQSNGEIPKGWHIHHINGIKTDNRLENLIAIPTRAHCHQSPLKLLLKKTQQKVQTLEALLNNAHLL